MTILRAGVTTILLWDDFDDNDNGDDDYDVDDDEDDDGLDDVIVTTVIR